MRSGLPRFSLTKLPVHRRPAYVRTRALLAVLRFHWTAIPARRQPALANQVGPLHPPGCVVFVGSLSNRRDAPPELRRYANDWDLVISSSSIARPKRCRANRYTRKG